MGKKVYRSANFNWDKLDAMLQFKVPLSFCADYLECSEDTIERRIRDEWDMTFSQYHALKMQRTSVKLQQKAIEMAIAGHATMLIFSLKNIANWSDRIESPDPKDMTKEELYLKAKEITNYYERNKIQS